MAIAHLPPHSGGSAPTAFARADVTTRHVGYLEHQQQWQRCADALAGTDAIKSNARAYVPRTRDHLQYPETYDDMISRSSYTNFVARTVDGLEGLVFRKDPSITVPSRFKPRLESLNNAGDNATTFAKKVCREVISYGRVGIMIDALPKEHQRFESTASLLPYLVMVQAQSITNWRVRTVDGQQEADQIVLHEFYDEADVFGSTIRNRYRVLEIDEQNRYMVRIFEQSSEGDYYLASENYPTTGSATGETYLSRIPFIFIGPGDLSPTVHRSPILDVVDATLDHYRLSTFYANALFLLAQPTPVVTGWPEGQPANFRLGGGNLWLLPEGASAEIMEFRGDGLGSLERAIVSKESQIADLGVRLLQSAARGPETAEAARIRQHSQTSVVSSIARTVSDGLKAAIQIACRWASADGKIEVELNQDFIDATMSPQMLAEIVRTTNSGLLTKRDAVWNMVRGEIVEPGRSVEEIVAELERERPILMGRADPAIGVPPRTNGAVAGTATGATPRRSRGAPPASQTPQE